MNTEEANKVQSAYNTIVELLIKIHGTQLATSSIMIEILGKDDKDKNELVALLNQESKRHIRDLMAALPVDFKTMFRME